MGVRGAGVNRKLKTGGRTKTETPQESAFTSASNGAEIRLGQVSETFSQTQNKISITPLGAIGDISLYRFSNDRLRLILPVPPSVNRRNSIFAIMTARGPRAIVRTRKETTSYLEQSRLIYSLIRRAAHNPIADFTPFYFQFYLDNKNTDTHNGYKVVCDLLQYSRVVTNDKYILVQTLRPIYHESKPHLSIEFPLNSEIS